MKILKALTNCDRATFLIEKRELAKLSISDGLQLRLHLIGCKVCRLYLKQSQKINELVDHLLKPKSNKIISMDQHSKEKIHAQIMEQLIKK